MTQCSKECGGGEKRRQVVCGSDGSGRRCPEDLRPRDTAPCNTHACPEWSIGDWGQVRGTEILYVLTKHKQIEI